MQILSFQQHDVLNIAGAHSVSVICDIDIGWGWNWGETKVNVVDNFCFLPVWLRFFVPLVRLVRCWLVAIHVCSIIFLYLYYSFDHISFRQEPPEYSDSIRTVLSPILSGHVWNCTGQWLKNKLWKHQHLDMSDDEAPKSVPE